MKHIVIIVAMVFGVMWLVRASTVGDAAQENSAVAPASVDTEYSAVMAMNASDRMIRKAQGANVGMLFYSGDNLTSARLRKTLASKFEEFAKLNILHSGGSVDLQLTMFEKMLKSQYSTVIVELGDVSLTEKLIDMAMENNTSLILTGNIPDLKLLQKYDKVYYVGYNTDNFISSVVGELKGLYAEDELSENSSINYSTVLASNEASEIVQKINEASEQHGLPLKEKVTSKISQLNYDLEDELDKIIKDKTEVVFFDDPVALKRSLDYFDNSEKFPNALPIKAVMLEYDENAEEFKAHKNVAMVMGYDDAALAKTIVKLTMILARDVKPTEELMDMKATDGKAFYVDYSIS